MNEDSYPSQQFVTKHVWHEYYIDPLLVFWCCVPLSLSCILFILCLVWLDTFLFLHSTAIIKPDVNNGDINLPMFDVIGDLCCTYRTMLYIACLHHMIYITIIYFEEPYVYTCIYIINWLHVILYKNIILVASSWP